MLGSKNIPFTLMPIKAFLKSIYTILPPPPQILLNIVFYFSLRKTWVVELNWKFWKMTLSFVDFVPCLMEHVLD